jgi:hypothetical protein
MAWRGARATSLAARSRAQHRRGMELASTPLQEADMKQANFLLAAILAVAAGGCSDPTGDQAGADMRSRSTGERNERLGNDPAQQNTGEGSIRDEERRSPAQ